jgi:hypothetical protein
MQRIGCIEGLVLRSLGSACSFLDKFEFIEKVDPADTVLVAGFQTAASRAVVR